MSEDITIYSNVSAPPHLSRCRLFLAFDKDAQPEQSAVKGRNVLTPYVYRDAPK